MSNNVTRLDIEAVFIGKDGSMGFTRDSTYELWLFYKNGKYYISRRSMSSVAIPYDTRTAIKKNWSISSIKCRPNVSMYVLNKCRKLLCR